MPRNCDLISQRWRECKSIVDIIFELTLDIIFELALLSAFCSAVTAGFGFVSPANGLIANLNSSHISAVTEAWRSEKIQQCRWCRIVGKKWEPRNPESRLGQLSQD